MERKESGGTAWGKACKLEQRGHKWRPGKWLLGKNMLQSCEIQVESEREARLWRAGEDEVEVVGEKQDPIMSP